ASAPQPQVLRHERKGASRGISSARQIGRRRATAENGAMMSGELEQPGRVFLDDERPHVFLNLNSLEIRKPAFRSNHRPVGTEQNLVLQKCVAILHKDLW